MPGLRIKHPTLTSGILQIPIPAKTDQGTDKSVQLVLDDEGCVLVSQGVWDEIMEGAENQGLPTGLLILNEVPDPPELVVGGNHPEMGRPTYTLEREALRQIAPAAVVARTVEHPINVRST